MSFSVNRRRARFCNPPIQALESRTYMQGVTTDDPLNEFGLPAVPAPATTAPPTPVASGPLVSLSSVPVMNSDPGAVATLYLDFHGEPAEAWGGQTVPATPAYDIDGDATTFSAQEISNIQEIWARVSEAFSPFNINVTTVDPGNWNLAGQGSSNHQLREVIGGNGAWTGQVEGGVAYVGSYYSSFLPNTVYVFPANLGNGTPQYTGDDAAHEAGHGFGLEHQSVYSGTTKTAEYNPGNGSTAPFMGNPLSPGIRGTWWDGQSSLGSTIIQDDLAVLSGSDDGFGYRTLMYGQSTGSATPLTISGGTFSDPGIIESTAQTDYFSFTTTAAGSDTFTVNVAPYGAMLHARLELHDASNNVLVVAAAAGTLSQSITATLPMGSYYLVVGSYGQYGDIGQYTVSGTVAVASGVTPVASISGAATATAGDTYTLALAAMDAGQTVTGWTINWGDGTTQSVTGNPASVSHDFAAAGEDSISATMSDDASGSYASNAVAVVVTAADTVVPPAAPVSPTLPDVPPPDDSGQVTPLVQPVPTVIGDLPVKGTRKVAGRFAATGSQNLYQFTLTQTQITALRLTSGKPGLAMQLLDANGNEITSKTGKRGIAQTLTLDAGTYEVEFAFSGIKPSPFHLVTATKPIPVHKRKAA